ncbi:uncharacterized protein LOC128265379 isoform X1 [Drosophila gunungcola]|uniref:uncharacterized protein LOC128265379 isoform X1 n=1 Tax=Drosophila gunungcola TaxID=103775 RepID=UPI0022E507BB|nr:uncharacterized protein LOC128265379 isoform X1 [Drosophila gunungcola]
MQQKVEEKIDPLTRIQEEIKEVVRREEEYRQLATLSSSTTTTLTSPSAAVEFEAYTVNGNGLDFGQKLDREQEQEQDQDQDQHNEHEQDQDHELGVLVTAQPATTSLLLPIDELSNTPSLASSVNSGKEESLDGQHSDDSGISASSQCNNNLMATGGGNAAKQPLKLTVVARQEQRYIGPNCYNLTPEPPQQKLITRTISTPQLSGLPQKRQFAFGGATKGVMQRFIASHGKLAPTSPLPPASPMALSLNLATNGNGYGNGSASTINININNNSNSQSNTLKLNTRTAMAFLESGGGSSASSVTLSPAAIERDSEGRPLRRGYVPVEQKIQRELQDLKSRESELKRLRKINRQNTLKASLDKLQLSTDDEADADDDDDEDSEVEHCYGPGKLRSAQSTQELDRNGNEQEIVHKSTGNRSLNATAYMANGFSNGNGNGNANGNGMRPAMSLAQLCDLTPEEAPSSRGLIAQWESLIKKNAEVGAVEAII